MTPQRNAKLRGVLPVLLVMAIILLMSATPGTQAGTAFRLITGPLRIWLRGTGFLAFLTRLDWFKVGHVILYAVLGAVVFRAFWRSGRRGVFWPMLIVLGFAILDELVQHFFPGRSARLSDVLLDTTAALIVMVVIKLIPLRGLRS